VIATGCGNPGTNGYGLVVATAQLAVNNPTNYPQFAGNVKTMDTRRYWRDVSVSPVGQDYHYNRNAETYMLTGDALARGMLALLNVTPPTIVSYGPWNGASFPLTFSGPSGQTYKVRSSANVTLPLTNWTVLASGTFGTNPVTYTHTSATNAIQFYRIQSP
jgi:hypothetical protein